MSPRPRQSLAFHADAYALIASFHRPAIVQVEALAATSLPQIGGHAHADLKEFSLPRLVRFDAAYSHVSGSMEDDETATTQAITSIEGLNIMDVVTADRIVSRLTSSHNIKEEEGHIIALGSTFDNFRVGGYRFDFVLRHEVLMKAKTHEALVKAVTSDRKQGKIAAHLHGATICSLVEEIKTDFPGLSDEDKKKHIVQIPNFGTLSFAEVFSACGTKTLTMLRFDLGSPDGGGGSAGGTSTNGRPSPPVG